MSHVKCTAEAQEVTIARAIELKHNPGLISALAHETSKMFTTAADNLHTLDQAKVRILTSDWSIEINTSSYWSVWALASLL